MRGVAEAVRTAMWRIALFHVGSMAVIVTLVPWDDPKVATLLAPAAMAGIFLLMLRQPDTRDQLLATGVLTVVLAVIGVVRQRRAAAVKN